jgi:hypothetical protein
MRELPNFVGGFIRSNKISFLVELVGIRIRSELEHLRNLDAQKPTEETLFEDYLEIKHFEMEEDPLAQKKSHDRPLEGILEEPVELSAFVDIALTLHKHEVVESLQHLRGLNRLRRYLKSDVPAAIAFLEREIALLQNMRESFDAIGLDRILCVTDESLPRRARAKSFDDEIVFLNMMRSLLLGTFTAESRESV